MMAKHTDSALFIKPNQILDWLPVEQLCHPTQDLYLRCCRDYPAYPLLPIFKAVLPGRWHCLSDPESERRPAIVFVTDRHKMTFCLNRLTAGLARKA
ncbi:hypothetical protein [Neisseria iguanae]|uniref:hypothetical protein n=1 Tax=Neisseria iguanae TaxID=90242 RepID=UPI00267B0BEE